MATDDTSMAIETSGATRFVFSQMHMGVAVRVTLFAADRSMASAAALAAFRRFRELDDMMSDYQTHSELNRLCRAAGQGPQPTSRELREVLSVADQVRKASDGAFDVSVGALTRLWRRARARGRCPEGKEIATALDFVGGRRFEVDEDAGTVSLKTGTSIDLGGIAKGYACDQALAQMTGHGVFAALVEAGGDMVASGPPPGRPGWKTAIEGSAVTLLISGQAVSTTGDANQGYHVGGQRRSHIVSPLTGWPLEQVPQTTLVADEGLWADALAQAEAVRPGSSSAFDRTVHVFRED